MKKAGKANNRPKHNHSKIATDIFKEWFYSNMRHPFPSDEVKLAFADRTGLICIDVCLFSELSVLLIPVL